MVKQGPMRLLKTLIIGMLSFHFLRLSFDIDFPRISAVPPFPGLRRFPDGRDFVQWTGDDSKALMKVISLLLRQHIFSNLLFHALGLSCHYCGPCTI
jgi:hypothetical protein